MWKVLSPQCIPADCEEETLKAQAIILRTLCMRAYENRQSIDDNTVYARDIGQEYLDMRSREALWEDSYEEKQAKIASAGGTDKRHVYDLGRPDY